MKQEIISRVDIQQYIGRFVSLKNKGGNQYIGLCPFHAEKTPSFTVSIDKKFFHCFGCKVSGDVIKFVMLYDNIQYENAIQKLASEFGVKISEKVIENNTYKQSIAINSRFAAICHELLFQNSEGLDYIYSRGITENMIREYTIGYLPIDKSNEVFKLLRNEFSEQEIYDSNLYKPGTKPYCPFVSRIIFPIHDLSGNNVGFGSRVIDSNGKPKYLNSSDSEIFHKSEILYGLNRISNNNQLKIIQTIFIVEGYMDVISLANQGITNCVGVLGANLTANQLQKLWKFTSKPTLCFDGDNAGITAMERAAKMSLSVISPGKTIMFLELKDCKDPDEYVRKFGFEAFLEYFYKHRISLSEYICKFESKDLHIENPDDTVVLRQRLFAISNEITNDVLRNEYKKYFNKLFYNKQSGKSEKIKSNIFYDTQLKFLKKNDSITHEMKICSIISENKYLLMDQEILDNFMNCQFESEQAKAMRIELTREVNISCIDIINDETKKNLNSLFIALKIQSVQNEILKLQVIGMHSENVEKQLLHLKRYEIQLKKELSSTLI